MLLELLRLFGLSSEPQQVVALCLILGHIIGDFPLQTNKLVTQRKERLLRSWWMYVHPLIHGAIAGGALYALEAGSLGFVAVCGGFVVLAHGLTDLSKDLISRRFSHPRAQPYFFALDQALHVAALVLVANWVEFGVFETPTIGELVPPTTLCILVGYAIMWWPMRYFIPLVLAGFLPQNVDSQDTAGQLGLGLPGAGQLIGRLERVLILTFVLLGRWEAIGFLLTAKSILRFPELSSNAQNQASHPNATPSPLTPEYVIAGTLLSMGGAVMMGMGVG